MFVFAQQMILGQCTNSSPAAFLKNFQVDCVTLLHSCPTGSPLQTQPADLTTEVMDGHGGRFYFPTILRSVLMCFDTF